MATKTPWRFIGSLAFFSLSAAALILLIPTLFDSGTETNFGALLVLGLLVVVFGAATVRTRPPRSRSR